MCWTMPMAAYAADAKNSCALTSNLNIDLAHCMCCEYVTCEICYLRCVQLLELLGHTCTNI